MGLISPSSRIHPPRFPNPAKVMNNETLETALDYVASLPQSGVLPRMFYYQMKLNGHMSWPQFRSTSLPTFPRLLGSESGSNQ